MKSFYMFVLGVVATFVLMNLFIVNQYGRLVNHQHCNMSLDTLGGIAASNYVYYTYYANND